MWRFRVKPCSAISFAASLLAWLASAVAQAGTRHCSCSTWTGSRRSTTPWGTPPATVALFSITLAGLVVLVLVPARRRLAVLLGAGAAAVVMCFDERGQADTYERRIAVAKLTVAGVALTVALWLALGPLRSARGRGVHLHASLLLRAERSRQGTPAGSSRLHG